MSMVVAGIQPWYPWPLRCWRWWVEPVPAERLAALRIGLAAVLLLDLLTTYLPGRSDFFEPGSLGGPEVFPGFWLRGTWQWSPLACARDAFTIDAALALWALAVVGLLIGFCTRVCAVAAWALSTTFARLNPEIDNAGDMVRGIILFYLMLAPAAATWSLDAWIRNRRLPPEARPADVRIHPWPLRLLFIQMAWIYFANGLSKVAGTDWLDGTSLYYVLADVTLARWSFASFPVPFFLTRLLTWLVLAWELSFPVLVVFRKTRFLALAVGVGFHLAIWLSLELGSFAPTMLCLYLPLLPWERCRRSAAKALPSL